MPELLIELLSEEIPARMQARATADLKALVTGGLVESGLTYEGAQSHAGPRRLVLSVEGLAGRSPETTEERKGPRVDAPRQAIEGFLRSAGVQLEDCKQVEDKKGRFLVARITRPGRATPEIVAELVPDIIRRFSWPKSMRWGSGNLRWVRPLHSILCTFDGETVPFSVDGIASGNLTRGHRFMAPAEFAVRRFEDYAARLAQAFVMVDAGERAETIRTEANNLAFAQGFEVVDDEGLLAETAGLVEWPVVLMGSFDEAFLALPPEVISTSIKHHQKCFSLKRRGGGTSLANRYLLVANLIARDGGKEIVAGNNRVIAARLSDARFFWDQDRKTKLEDLLPKLEGIVFHGKLGSQRERVVRIEHLAGEIAGAIGADVDQARLAAKLCKADLVTGMVGEFPELQGLMGYYYALTEGHDPEVAEAIRDHYKPQGPSDTVPASKIGRAVALADRFDQLVGFFGNQDQPTGSRDPYALRRATLGIIRMVLEGGERIKLSPIIVASNYLIAASLYDSGLAFFEHFHDEDKSLLDLTTYYPVRDQFRDDQPRPTVGGARSDGIGFIHGEGCYLFPGKVQSFSIRDAESHPTEYQRLGVEETLSNLLAFFADRLKVYLREQGARHDLIDAVFALSAPSPPGGEGRGRGGEVEPTSDPTPSPSPRGGGGQDDLLMIVRRVEALGRFLDTEDGGHLLIGVKRAINIVRIEEKRDATSYDAPPDRNLLVQGEEKALATAIDRAEAQAKMAVEAEDFEAAMRAIAKLRGPIDTFFDRVTVNADDPSFRANRLKLLNRIRAATLTVADFSRIEG